MQPLNVNIHLELNFKNIFLEHENSFSCGAEFRNELTCEPGCLETSTFWCFFWSHHKILLVSKTLIFLIDFEDSPNNNNYYNPFV